MTVQGTGGVSSDDKRVQDGQKQCVRGAWVKISEEYKEWDVFRKFMGKVGRLTTRSCTQEEAHLPSLVRIQHNSNP